jgi:hypothetical protein
VLLGVVRRLDVCGNLWHSFGLFWLANGVYIAVSLVQAEVLDRP